MDSIVGTADLSADIVKSRAGIVTDLILVDDASANLFVERCQGLDAGKTLRQGIARILPTLCTRVGFCPFGNLKKTADRQQFLNA